MNGKRLLIVDDQVDISTYIGKVAESFDYQVMVTNDSIKFMQLYHEFKPDSVIMDIFMPERDGIELLRMLAKEKKTPRILFISGSDEFFLGSALKLARDLGFVDARVMQKPLRYKDLCRFLDEEEFYEEPASAEDTLYG